MPSGRRSADQLLAADYRQTNHETDSQLDNQEDKQSREAELEDILDVTAEHTASQVVNSRNRSNESEGILCDDQLHPFAV